jgi:hypothetical protein
MESRLHNTFLPGLNKNVAKYPFQYTVNAMQAMKHNIIYY